jgi:outer membrane protein
MAPKEKEELEKQIATLFQDYQVKGKALQQIAGQRQGEEQNKIIALVRQAVDNIATKGKYDIVLEQKSVLFVQPEFTITDQVIEQVSKIK